MKNVKRLIDDCYKSENGVRVPKRKTEHIIELISTDEYQRNPKKEILLCTKQEAKTLIIARFGMLECGRNYKGGMNEICNQCNVLDDENHRLNSCPKYREFNYFEDHEKVSFAEIYSDDMETVRRTISKIERVWDTKCAHGSLNK